MRRALATVTGAVLGAVAGFVSVLMWVFAGTDQDRDLSPDEEDFLDDEDDEDDGWHGAVEAVEEDEELGVPVVVVMLRPGGWMAWEEDPS